MPTLMRTIRLRRHADYGLVYGASRKYRSGSLSFFYRERPAEPLGAAAPASPRFGITVPRALGPAVLRNRIKRRVRVAARAALALLPAGVDVVLHPRPVIATMPFAALCGELESVFRTVAQRIAAGAPNVAAPRVPRPGKRAGGSR